MGIGTAVFVSDGDIIGLEGKMMPRIVRKYRMTRKHFCQMLLDDGRRIELNSPVALKDSEWLSKAAALPTREEEEQLELDRQAGERMDIFRDVLREIRAANEPKSRETVDEYLTRIKRLRKPTDTIIAEEGEVVR